MSLNHIVSSNPENPKLDVSFQTLQVSNLKYSAPYLIGAVDFFNLTTEYLKSYNTFLFTSVAARLTLPSASSLASYIPSGYSLKFLMVCDSSEAIQISSPFPNLRTNTSGAINLAYSGRDNQAYQRFEITIFNTNGNFKYFVCW